MPELWYEGPGKVAWRESSPVLRSGEDDVIVRPLVVAMCDLDRFIARGGSPFPPPFALGHELVAEVVESADGSSFTAGDVVAVSYQPSCGACTMCSRGRTAACLAVPKACMYGVGPAGGDFGGAFSDRLRVPYPAAMLQRLPPSVSPLQAAVASDSLLDGYRCVAGPLEAIPGGSVLIAGDGSVAMFAAHCAVRLGAERVSFYSRDARSLERAESLGAAAFEVEAWPRRFPSHAITVDATGDPDALSAVVDSTQMAGYCTCAAMFVSDVALPMDRMYLRGITFEISRTDGAAGLPRMLDAIGAGVLDPMSIRPAVVAWDDAPDALLGAEPKVIVDRSAPAGT